MSWTSETLVLAILVGITTQAIPGVIDIPAPHYCYQQMVDWPRCNQNQREECKECPECLPFIKFAWGTWHKVGQPCKCDYLWSPCYEGKPDWFSWDNQANYSKDYADPWAGAGPPNLNKPATPARAGIPRGADHGFTRSPRIERLNNNRLASDHWGPGNPRMTILHSNRRIMPRIPGQSRQTAHVGMVRPRMGLASQNIKSNRMVNMHSRNMNPNLDDNSVMASSGQEAGSCWGCIGGLVLAAAGCWEDAVALPIFIACVAGAEGLVGCDMDACVCPWICGSSIYSAACNACHEFSGGTTAAPTPAPALTQVP